MLDPRVIGIRFKKVDLFRLQDALSIPPSISTENRLRFLGIEALCVVLRRLAYPNRLDDITHVFGRSADELSRIFYHICNDLGQRYSGILRWDAERLTPELLHHFCDAVHDAGSPLTTVFGFIDGTVRRMARPSRYQRQWYSGMKKTHAHKFQGVVSPDGIIIHEDGPYRGPDHDIGMYRMSTLERILEQHGEFFFMRNSKCSMAHKSAAIGPAGETLHIYGDPGYLPGTLHLIVPWKLRLLTPAQEEFNRRMSGVRIAIEWAWDKVATEWAFLNYWRNLRIGLSPIALYYKVGILLSNCRSCLYGNETAAKFGVKPPSLEHYLNKN